MITRFWLRPRDGNVKALAQRLLAATHTHVMVKDDLVGFVPFEEVPALDWERVQSWVNAIESHFEADFIESA